LCSACQNVGMQRKLHSPDDQKPKQFYQLARQRDCASTQGYGAGNGTRNVIFLCSWEGGIPFFAHHSSPFPAFNILL
jgi:hypothetical protein